MTLFMNHLPGIFTRTQQSHIEANPRKSFYFKTFRSIFIIILLNCMPGSQHIFAQWSSDPATNTVISFAPRFGGPPNMVPGDNGNTTILWYDRIDKNTANIYVKELNSAGVAEWTATQFAIFNPIQTPFPPQIISDGAGGVIIAWSDYRSGNSLDIVAQKINAAGQPMWTANGVLLCAASGDQEISAMIPDGKGGAVIAWTDYRSGIDPDIYVQHINASGTTQWTTNGVAVAAEPGFQSGAVLLLNAAGNTI